MKTETHCLYTLTEEDTRPSIIWYDGIVSLLLGDTVTIRMSEIRFEQLLDEYYGLHAAA